MSAVEYSRVPDFRLTLVEGDASPTETDKQRQILEALQAQEDTLEFLHSLTSPEQRLAVAALVDLPAETAMELYGASTLAWAYVATAKVEHLEILKQRLVNTPYKIDRLSKARQWAEAEMINGTSRDAMDQYALMELLLGGTLKTLDISEALASGALEGVVLSTQRMDGYALVPLISNPQTQQAMGSAANWETQPPSKELIDYHIHLDAPVGVVLAYKDVPQAVLGLSVLGSNELMIHQIQGIRGTRIDPNIHAPNRIAGKSSARGLAPFDWKKLMVSIAEEIAKMTGMESLGIQEAKQNRWVGLKDMEPQKAREIYDETAERMGFKRGRDGNWHKAVA